MNDSNPKNSATPFRDVTKRILRVPLIVTDKAATKMKALESKINHAMRPVTQSSTTTQEEEEPQPQQQHDSSPRRVVTFSKCVRQRKIPPIKSAEQKENLYYSTNDIREFQREFDEEQMGLVVAFQILAGESSSSALSAIALIK